MSVCIVRKWMRQIYHHLLIKYYVNSVSYLNPQRVSNGNDVIYYDITEHSAHILPHLYSSDSPSLQEWCHVPSIPNLSHPSFLFLTDSLQAASK